MEYAHLLAAPLAGNLCSFRLPPRSEGGVVRIARPPSEAVIVAKMPKFYEEFRVAYPAVAEHYSKLGDACRAAGPLDHKSAELVKLALSIAVGSEGGAHSHTRRALTAGASRAELEHVALLSITTLGFPRAMTGLAWMRDVLDPAPKG